jgi:hypothetical protein
MALPPPSVEAFRTRPPAAGSAASLWDQLRGARANVQGLIETIVNLRAAGSNFDDVLTRERALWEENAAQVDHGIERARDAIDAGGAGPDEIADELDLLDNAWERAKAYWAAFVAAPPTKADAREEQLAAIDVLLVGMVRRFGFLTIPRRVQQYLRRQRIGGAFDFHAAFQDELPSEADRIELLRYLHASPGSLYGVVDVDNGIIWATSPDPRRRLRTYIVVGLIPLLGVAATIGLAQLNVGGPFVPARRDELVIAYVMIALGVVVHIVIDVYKQSRATSAGGSRTAVDDLILWGHAHELQLYVTALSVFAGLAALAFLFARIEPLTAFIAGYSLDSFLDAVLMRFSNTLDAGSAALRRQVDPS